MPDPWPVLTEDTAVLDRLARRLARTGVPVRELQHALVHYLPDAEPVEENETQSDSTQAAPRSSAQPQVAHATAAQTIAEIESQINELPLAPGLARGWLAGLLHEQALAREQRRRQGAYYTPRGIANYMLLRALALLGEQGPELRVLDPAAGSGAFLLSALEIWRARHAAGTVAAGTRMQVEAPGRLELTGLDLDAGALASARLALTAAGIGRDSAAGAGSLRLEIADSLLAEPPLGGGAYDIVAGNPPYLDSERLSRQQPGLRDTLRARFRTARGNWDMSCVFVERALELTRPGGVAAMLVPRKLLAADYAAALHELLLEHELVEACDLAGLPVFKAGVQAAVLIARRRTGVAQAAVGRVLCRTAVAGPEADQRATPQLLRALPPGYFCAAFSPAAERITGALAKYPPLEQFAEVGDGCSTAEAYRLAGLLHDDKQGGGVKLVNTGLIKPYAVLWGVRELAYLKQRYRYPRFDPARLGAEYPRRWRQAHAPKLLLPGLASELWAVADCGGEWACGKGAVQVLPKVDGALGGEGLPLLAWAAWLNSAPVRWLYRVLFGGRGFGEGSLHIGPRQLKCLPVPWAGLATCADELASLAGVVTQQQQVLWEQGAGAEKLASWLASMPAKRIDALVQIAYGWPLDFRA